MATTTKGYIIQGGLFKMQNLRLYNLENKSQKELKQLLDTVKTHSELSYDEKEANIEAINIKLNGLNKHRPDLMIDILAGQSDISDLLSNT